jgi:hypothetical protein
MPYLKQLYEDEDHFVCDRVVEFKKLVSQPSEPAEATVAIVSDEKDGPEILESKWAAHSEDQTQRPEDGGEQEPP